MSQKKEINGGGTSASVQAFCISQSGTSFLILFFKNYFLHNVKYVNKLMEIKHFVFLFQSVHFKEVN